MAWTCGGIGEAVESFSVDEKPEIAPQGETKHFNWQWFILLPVVMAVLYVLSLGPVIMLVDKGRISGTSSLEAFYHPLERAYRRPQSFINHWECICICGRRGSSIKTGT